MVCSASTTACCKGRGVNSNTASKVRCVDASGKRASQPVLFKASSAFCCRRVSNQLGRSAQSSGVPNGKYCWFEPIQSAKLVSPASRSEEHTSELQSLMRISYAVFCLKKKKNKR